MHRIVPLVLLAVAACACAGIASSSRQRTPVTAKVTNLEASPHELRIRVRCLIRPTLGIVEESADRILAEDTDPVVRRAALVWKIETTTTLLAALLRDDPVLALADAWGYVLQVEAVLRRPGAVETFGPSLGVAMGALTQIQDEFREFAGSLQEGVDAGLFEGAIREWADHHPIEGALYRRPAMDSAVADVLASSGGQSLFATLSGLEETTADVMFRMDLYTMYLPRLARWEAEMAVDDLAPGADPNSVLADFERFTRAADRIAGVAESTPALVAGERQAAVSAIGEERSAVMRELRAERAVVLQAIHQERVETLGAVEAMARRLVDRSSGPFHEGVRVEADNLVNSVEAMRRRFNEDIGSTLERVVDHAFVRALQLLLVVTALAALGLLLHARVRRRAS